MPKWKFRPKAEGEIKEDPIQERFFTTSDVGDLTNALIREAIQNSMDARIKKSGPANLRFYLCSGGIESSSHNIILNGLKEHLEAENSGLDRIPDFSRPMPYLIIDDYFTTGLAGDILEEDDPPPNDPSHHNFYWFWRNIARSGKGENDLGRWGVGKTVYSASSDINTFFGLTIRYDDNKKYLMGKTVLKWHTLGGGFEWYCPYGFYANYKKDDSFFALPFSADAEPDKPIIEAFESTFDLNRIDVVTEKELSGLTIVIPYIKEEINLNGIKKAIIQQYFYPVIEDKLRIEIASDSGAVLSINKDTIEEILGNVDFEDPDERKNFRKIFSVAKETLGLKESDYIKLKRPPLDKSPRWQDSWLYDEHIYKQIDEARCRFENGEIISFKIPLKVQERDKDPIICWYKAFVQYDGFLKETDSYFIRDGITISGIKTIKKKGLRMLIVIDEQKIAKMFGDSENPAHTEFQKTAPLFRNNYVDGPACITFLTNTVGNLYNLLIRPSEGTDDDILRDIFYVEIEPSPETGRTEPVPKHSGDEEPGKEKPEKIPSNISPILMRQVNGGVTVNSNPESEKLPDHLCLQLAYMVPRGNPLKKYNPWDFNLSDGSLEIVHNGITIISIQENRMEFNITADEFSIQITGFDPNRDLFVKV